MKDSKYEDESIAVKDVVIEQILNRICLGRKIDIHKLDMICESLYSEIHKNSYVEKCLNDLRNADIYTYNHSLNVSFYAMLIGKWMGFSRTKIKEIATAGLLHDIGKIIIPYEVLNKKGRLDSKEFETIKMHTIYGYNIVKNMKGISEDICSAVLMHHEREDQSGYPLNLKSNQINIHTKIIAVADVYDAMTSERVYKKGVKPSEAFEMFRTEGLKTFDISIVHTFLNNLMPYYSVI